MRIALPEKKEEKKSWRSSGFGLATSRGKKVMPPKRRLPRVSDDASQPAIVTTPVKPVIITEGAEGVYLRPSDEDVHIEKGRVTGRYVRYRTLVVIVRR